METSSDSELCIQHCVLLGACMSYDLELKPFRVHAGARWGYSQLKYIQLSFTNINACQMMHMKCCHATKLTNTYRQGHTSVYHCVTHNSNTALVKQAGDMQCMQRAPCIPCSVSLFFSETQDEHHAACAQTAEDSLAYTFSDCHCKSHSSLSAITHTSLNTFVSNAVTGATAPKRSDQVAEGGEVSKQIGEYYQHTLC